MTRATKRFSAEIELLKKRIARLQALNREDQRALRALRQRERHYRDLFNKGSEGVVIMTLDLTIVEVNQAYADMHGYPVERFKGMPLDDITALKPGTRKARRSLIRRMRAGHSVCFEVEHYHRDGHILPLSVTSGIVRIAGRPFYLGFLQDITKRRRIEKELKRSKEELRREQITLQRKNVTLRELLEHMERAKNKMREDVAMNVEGVLLPVLETLRLQGISSKYVDLLRHHLNHLASSYGRRLSQKSPHLSPREMELCHLLKGGLKTKDISSLLQLSDKTVDKHRRNIRKKLALSNEKVNLTAYLRRL